MNWTTEDKAALLVFKDAVDSDNIKVKERIKKLLLQNKFVIHLLNNKELEEADSEPDDYYGVNILPFYLIDPTQSNVQNFVCFEVSYDEIQRHNAAMKNLEIVFYVICEQRTLLESETGIARHDLLAAAIQDQFNYTNYFGAKIKLISDRPSTTDNGYATRTLIFRQITDNNLVKTKNGIARYANKDVVVYEE